MTHPSQRRQPTKEELIDVLLNMAERLEEAAEEGGLSASACKERALMLRNGFAARVRER